MTIGWFGITINLELLLRKYVDLVEKTEVMGVNLFESTDESNDEATAIKSYMDEILFQKRLML